MLLAHFLFPSKLNFIVSGTAYVLNTVSWVLALVTGGAVIVTGISAEKGHRWAAGNRAYQPIEG